MSRRAHGQIRRAQVLERLNATHDRTDAEPAWRFRSNSGTVEP